MLFFDFFISKPSTTGFFLRWLDIFLLFYSLHVVPKLILIIDKEANEIFLHTKIINFSSFLSLFRKIAAVVVRLGVIPSQN